MPGATTLSAIQKCRAMLLLRLDVVPMLQRPPKEQTFEVEQRSSRHKCSIAPSLGARDRTNLR
jgi:hypothetical protein